ncbi:MAG: (2Fe-2S)-binding protein [Alphaproteobacteria bacterium]|nr:(2Fe-2S)-binding protein [Alphaproteobacteria bacterium]
MTPFKIRRRLKSLLGQPERAEIVRYPVTFLLPDGTEEVVHAEEHYSLLMAADAHGITISTGRRAGGTCPDGHCATCRVEIVSSAGLSPMTDAERESLQDALDGKPHEGRARKPAPPASPNTRLGCYTKIRGPGARVKILELFDPDSIRGE